MPKLKRNVQQAIELFFQGKDKQAIKILEQEIKENPKSVQSYEALGDMYLHLQQPDKALPPLIWAVKLNPKSFLGNFLLGVAYGKNTKFKEGIEYLKKADKMKPNNDEVIRNLGWTTCMSGKRKQGRELLQRAIKINPKNGLTYNDMAASYIFKETKELDKAEKWFKKALKVEPDNPFIQQTYEGFLEMKQRADEEEKEITKAIRKMRSKASKKSLEDHDIIEIAPYNYCDRLCEKCKQQKICRVYQDEEEFKEKCLKEGRDPDSMEEAFKQVEFNFKLMRRMIEEDTKKMGVTLEPVTKKELAEEEEFHRKTMNSTLFKKAVQFSKTCRKFLDKVLASVDKDPMLGSILGEEIEKFIHYYHLCEPKLYRALSQSKYEDEDDEGFGQDDAFRSMAIVLSSLNICQNALKNIMETEEKDWVAESLLLNTHIKEFRECLLKKYPEIKDYKEKIIINTRQ